MKFTLSLLAAAVLFLAGCSETVTRSQVDNVSRADGPRILAMGDSLMAWHGVTERSITHSLANELGEPVLNRSIGGARIIYGLPISGSMGMKIANQYKEGNWDWIVLNGGGNDLWLGCGCVACDPKIERMISEDGRKGAIPHLVDSLRKTGANIVYVGYLRSPGVWSPIEECRDDGDKLEARIEKLAEILPNVHFVSLKDLVPHGDRSYHGADMIHPSLKASREIGKRVAAVIKASETAQLQ
ncbi:SGNH/GDSL hydrolase family protein [Shimia aestuarii]|uniref:Lysophospholipase L1 n=1 Tax=Shimia aestuarii TaxID=254406 RepID=A0A1I4MHI6_9RHOB|nr:SGNH/GDSL hydrolase family protein [Shimia aestuarii]SFM02526.1 Lysophospholipase L1 [Shimia aestuarii]